LKDARNGGEAEDILSASCIRTEIDLRAQLGYDLWPLALGPM